MPIYRDVAMPQLEALMAARTAFHRSHPVYRCAQVISHLSYRGPDQRVSWHASTAVSVLEWANFLGISNGLPLPEAMSLALEAIHLELRRARGDIEDPAIDGVEAILSDLHSLWGFKDGVQQIEVQLEWPSIEWVKTPIDLGTGLPNDSAITLRHFADCDHFKRNDDGTWTGLPPSLATDEQMEELRPCKDCVARAERSGNDTVGPRLGSGDPRQLATDWVSNVPTPLMLDLDDTDITATVRARREQAHLRKGLLAGAPEAPCAICGRVLTASVLVAAHIFPRRRLNDAERLNFASAAMLVCALGCDALFELGYLIVREDGTLVAGRPTTGALAEAVDVLAGRQCSAFNEATASNFRRHAEIHNKLHPSR